VQNSQVAVWLGLYAFISAMRAHSNGIMKVQLIRQVVAYCPV